MDRRWDRIKGDAVELREWAADVMAGDGARMGWCEGRGEEGGYQSLAEIRSEVCRLHVSTLWGEVGDLGEVGVGGEVFVVQP